MRTDRDLESLRRRLLEAVAHRDRRRATGPDEAFHEAYVAVKRLEMRIDERQRQTRL